MSTPAIELHQLAKTFHPRGEKPVEAVRSIGLSINQGEVVAFLGPNGAGKTTTLDMVLGLTKQTKGEAKVFGLDPHDAVIAGRVSGVLQSGGLLRDLSVRETAEVIASMFAQPESVDDVLARAGIEHLAKRKVSKCSGGEQQRLRFALALLPDPDLIILDEPTAGMDVSARQQFWDAMKADAANGRTVLFATHYLAEAEDFAQRTVLVDQGRVIADGPTEQIREHAGAREIKVTVPDVGLATARIAALGADVAGTQGNRLTIRAGNSDEIALALLRDLGGTDLEVALPSLDQAFQQLTADDRKDA